MSSSDNDNTNPAGPSQFVTEAYSLDSKESIISFYRKWAADYDVQMTSQGYCSPRSVADLLSQFTDSSHTRVLDAGCGTGLTGKYAVENGIPEIDGIDISGEMISVARARNIYRKLVVGDLNQPLPFDDYSYDAIICSGTFTHGHVGPEPLHELVRVLRPAGLLSCTIHFDLWHSRGFDQVLAGLISSGQLQCLSLHEGPYYQDGENEGWFCLYQKA